MVMWHATSAVWQRMKANGNKRSKLPYNAFVYIKIFTYKHMKGERRTRAEEERRWWHASLFGVCGKW